MVMAILGWGSFFAAGIYKDPITKLKNQILDFDF
jgi:hypothetical protein